MTPSPDFASSASSDLLGCTEPRLWTPPLRELTRQTSYGYAVVEFARDVVGEPLDPWQEWAAIHAGELLPDGRPRFRRVLLLVARQNGKTHLLMMLTLYWLFVERQKLIVGMSTKLDYARESWEKAVEAIQTTEALAGLLPSTGVRRTNGEQQIVTSDACRYKISASNRRGGRSLSIDRLISDELREQATWEAYHAAYLAMNARPHGQAFFVSNMGDNASLVLNSLRSAAITFLETGEGDARLGLMEWSGPEDCELDDVQALAAANPNARRRLDWDTLLGEARHAKARGGAEEAGFRTEVLCQLVAKLDPAIDPRDWAACGPREGREAPCLDALRDRVCLGVDVTPDGLHASVYAAALDDDGHPVIDPVKAWTGPKATSQLRSQLPALVNRIRPRAVGWLPVGPAASVAAELAERKGGVRRWPPVGVKVEAIKAEATQACMGLEELVRSGQLRHGGDPLLGAQVAQARRGKRGGGWVFIRGQDQGGYVDALYAAAAAVHLARTQPVKRTVQQVLTVP